MLRSLSYFFVVGLCLIAAGLTQAQTPQTDVIYKLDRSTVKAKVGEITSTDVFYAEVATPKIARKISKTDLWKIVFADGTSDVYNTPKGSSTPSAASASQSLTRTEPVPAQPVRQPVARQESVPLSAKGAYQSNGPRSIIKYAPLSSFGYEHVLGNNHSIYAGLSLYSLGFGVSAIGVKGEYRFYGLVKSSPKQAPEGLWVAPTVLLWNVSSSIDGTESVFIAQVGAIAGYQWIFNNKISLEPALGLSLTAVGSGSDSSLGAGIVPLFALRVGYVIK